MSLGEALGRGLTHDHHLPVVQVLRLDLSNVVFAGDLVQGSVHDADDHRHEEDAEEEQAHDQQDVQVRLLVW